MQISQESGPFSVGVNVDIDVAALSKMLIDVIRSARNRGAFVKDTLNKCMYSSKGNYSILVYNLQRNYKWDNAPDVANTLYTSVNYARVTYGIWMFKDYSVFQNLGDGGYLNWAFFGKIQRKDARVTFQPM